MPGAFHMLCAVDFSPASAAALGSAIGLARARPGCRITVIHVVDASAEDPSSAGPLLAALVAQHRDAAIPTDVRIVHPTATIAEAILAAAPGHDLLVVGTHGKRTLDRVLLGTVSERVARGSPVSVLVVPPGGRREKIAKIVCAFDPSPGAEIALRQAMRLSQEHGAALEVVHAWELVPMVPADVDFVPRHERMITRDIGHALERLGAGSVPRAIRYGAPSLEIVQQAVDAGADLIVTGTSDRTGVDRFVLGSVAERIVRTSPVAVLVARG
jgi:nucleotide-binding universal stress UspA family protein